MTGYPIKKKESDTNTGEQGEGEGQRGRGTVVIQAKELQGLQQAPKSRQVKGEILLWGPLRECGPTNILIWDI